MLFLLLLMLAAFGGCVAAVGGCVDADAPGVEAGTDLLPSHKATGPTAAPPPQPPPPWPLFSTLSKYYCKLAAYVFLYLRDSNFVLSYVWHLRSPV